MGDLGQPSCPLNIILMNNLLYVQVLKKKQKKTSKACNANKRSMSRRPKDRTLSHDVS